VIITAGIRPTIRHRKPIRNTTTVSATSPAQLAFCSVVASHDACSASTGPMFWSIT